MESYGTQIEGGIWLSTLRVFPYFILTMLFGLNGFLTAGSLLRTKTVREFLTLRAVRIVPTLLVEVLRSALISKPVLEVMVRAVACGLGGRHGGA